jgi:hypothetical protein
VSAGAQDSVDVADAEPWNAEEHFTGSTVHIDGEAFLMAEGPGEFGVEGEIEVGLSGTGDFIDLESVEAQEPIGLIEPVLADEGRGFDRENGGGFWDGAKGRVVDAPEMVRGVKFISASQEDGIGGGIGSNEHLGALTGGEGRRFWGVGSTFFGMALLDFFADVAHGHFGSGEAFFRGERVEALLTGEFDVDANPVGVTSGEGDEFGGCLRDGFKVNVAAKMVVLAEFSSDLDDQFHGVVGAADDAAAQEEALDVVAFVKVEGELHDFIRSEAGSSDVAGATVDAVMAIVEAGVGEEDFQQ